MKRELIIDCWQLSLIALKIYTIKTIEESRLLPHIWLIMVYGLTQVLGESASK